MRVSQHQWYKVTAVDSYKQAPSYYSAGRWARQHVLPAMSGAIQQTHKKNGDMVTVAVLASHLKAFQNASFPSPYPSKKFLQSAIGTANACGLTAASR